MNFTDSGEYLQNNKIYCLRSIEEGFFIRKASIADEYILLDALGPKNPYLFTADINISLCYMIHLYNANKKATFLNLLVNLSLNSDTYSQPIYYYLNSSMRYYFPIEVLINEIYKRNSGISLQLEHAFDSVAFHCFIDSSRKIWCPFFKEGNVLDDDGFCNTLVLIELSINPTGFMIFKNIKQLDLGTHEALSIIALCLMTKYKLTSQMAEYISSITDCRFDIQQYNKNPDQFNLKLIDFLLHNTDENVSKIQFSAYLKKGCFNPELISAS